MTLMRFDPFRELDRLAEQAFSVGTRAVRSMPMEALRRGDQFLVFLDLPGVSPDDVDVTVERNVVTIRARRYPQRQEGDEVIVDERPYGEFMRQLFLGENLDPSGLSADMDNGVLTMTIPVSETSKPRRIQLGSQGTATSTEATASDTAGQPATAQSSAKV
ncbi:Hsp20/alpha crystallin family protein [Pseudonocardia sp. H11422]|uniref:Hsp20/alpha crystallin family protein n=1 Tax=Pseudonocardia sp. H11422 TaxID=2835866 RepID=UPI003977D0E0